MALWLKCTLRWFEMVSLGWSLSEQFSQATCFPLLTVAVFPDPRGTSLSDTHFNVHRFPGCDELPLLC